MSFRNKKEYLKLLTILIPFVLFLVYGLILTFQQSIGINLPVTSDFSGFDAYKQLLTDKWFLQSSIFSVSVAMQSSVYSIIIGTLLAYWLWLQPNKTQKKLLVYKIPLILPHIVAAFFIQLIFSKSGLISSITYNLGIINNIASFPEIVYSPKGFGIVLAYIYKEVPFVIILQLANYSRINKELIVAAENLGAGKFMIFHKIILPNILPTINSTLIILFLYSLGAFEIPFLLGASRPEMIPVFIYNLYFNNNLNQRPLAMAALTLLFIFSSIFIGLYYFISRKINTKGRYI